MTPDSTLGLYLSIPYTFPIDPQEFKDLQDTVTTYRSLPFLPEDYPTLPVYVVPMSDTKYIPPGSEGEYRPVLRSNLPQDPAAWRRYRLGLWEPPARELNTDSISIRVEAPGESEDRHLASALAHELGHADNKRLEAFFRENPQVLSGFPRRADTFSSRWVSRDHALASSPAGRSAWVQASEFPSLAQEGASGYSTGYSGYFYGSQPDREYHHLSAPGSCINFAAGIFRKTGQRRKIRSMAGTFPIRRICILFGRRYPAVRSRHSSCSS